MDVKEGKDAQDHAHLDAVMRAENLGRGWRWTEVASRALDPRGNPMSPQNLLRIRKGEQRVTAEAAQQIDNAYDWEPGSAFAVLAGGQPIRRKRTSFDPLTATPREVVQYLDRMIEAGPDAFWEAVSLIHQRRSSG